VVFSPLLTMGESPRVLTDAGASPIVSDTIVEYWRDSYLFDLAVIRSLIIWRSSKNIS
jgi:hypothetical protein